MNSDVKKRIILWVVVGLTWVVIITSFVLVFMTFPKINWFDVIEKSTPREKGEILFRLVIFGIYYLGVFKLAGWMNRRVYPTGSRKVKYAVALVLLLVWLSPIFFSKQIFNFFYPPDSIYYGILKPAAATITPRIVQPGQKLTILYRWQGGPATIDLKVHTILRGTGFDEKGWWHSDSILDDFMPPIPTRKWSGLTEFERTVTLPADIKAGHYSVSTSLLNPWSKIPATLQGYWPTAFMIGSYGVKDSTHYKPFTKEGHGMAPLMDAAYRGDITKMRELIAKGATASELNKALYFATGGTPVVNQVYNGSTEAVQILVENGADVNTPMCLSNAIQQGNLETIKYLFDHGININTKSNKTALSVAVLEDYPEIVQYLLEHHVDPNIKDNNGQTPLQQAFFSNDPAIIEILKKAGAK